MRNILFKNFEINKTVVIKLKNSEYSYFTVIFNPKQTILRNTILRYFWNQYIYIYWYDTFVIAVLFNFQFIVFLWFQNDIKNLSRMFRNFTLERWATWLIAALMSFSVCPAEWLKIAMNSDFLRESPTRESLNPLLSLE
jgi:hypothetical protein